MKTIINKFFLFAILLSFFLASIVGVYPNLVMADSGETYTSALDDLTKDSSFIKEDYKVDESNYSLEVIGISESKKYELFLYVYVPSGEKYNIKATSINISQEHKALDFNNYSLTLISEEGVFHKYLVNGLTVKVDQERYYEISSIFRYFNEELGDVNSSENNTTSEIAYKVGKSFRHTDNLDGGYDVYVEDLDLITVTDRYIGFFRYPDGGWFDFGEAVDVHFIAFSTDKKIDQLYEADLIYTTTPVKKSMTVTTTTTFGDSVVNKKTINYKNDMHYDGAGWGAPEYTWKSIESSSDFIKSEEAGQHYSLGIFDATTTIELKPGALSEISSQEWVIRFLTTEYDFYENGSGTHTVINYTAVSDVSILRLAFKTEGVTYNMGVVDNKTTGDENPSNDPTKTDTDLELKLWIKILIAVLLFGGLIWLLYKLGILKLIWNGFVIIVTAPFKFIIWLINKFRGY